MLFEEEEEKELYESLDNASSKVDEQLAQEHFQAVMLEYATLRPVVDAFFDKVTVNVDQPGVRANRLRLLSRIRGTLNKIADFSRIV